MVTITISDGVTTKTVTLTNDKRTLGQHLLYASQCFICLMTEYLVDSTKLLSNEKKGNYILDSRK